MNLRNLFIYILFVVFCSSCVPTQDLVYLQNKNDANPASITSIAFKPYRLQTNDILSISIKAIDPKVVEIFNSDVASGISMSDQMLYLKGYTVNDHGNIRLPILGEINVLGYTLEETREKIETLLLQEHFKKEAGIFVSVKLSGFRYTVNGEVNNTGTKIMYQDRVNVLEAIANSGDITVTGDRKDVKVIRQFPQGTETFSLDLTDQNVVYSTGYYLQPNDYIYVKPLKQKTWGTGKTGIESLSTLITILSLATTTFLLLKK
ncbi:polysaccharide biosynthesis/export family protein [Flavobacterium aciduliphilum]|uniref:Protein involved in gliding motility EpsA n=1 Tax=Flavobacterium aciduliphilum TaxID=1101402 RepID=A0A328YUW8_9FLAO|nr:polysaccharide biosynthesis/export family protein [Flavobacterium aciduliphilum]RAR74337.1 protein involved in gliding motility EpsA [Flavobacterium aciduliphilum]